MAGGWALYVVNDNRAELHPVEIGKRSGITTQIVSGLVEGEQVINHPGDNVSHLTRVRAR